MVESKPSSSKTAGHKQSLSFVPLERNVVEYTRQELIQRFGMHPKDAGSSPVQVALLTQRIQNLSRHFVNHHDDKHSRRGMMTLISQRKGLLAHLSRTNTPEYKSLIGALGLRK